MKVYEVVCICPESEAWNGKSWRVPARSEDDACDKVLMDLEGWGDSHPKATLIRRSELQAYRI